MFYPNLATDKDRITNTKFLSLEEEYNNPPPLIRNSNDQKILEELYESLYKSSDKEILFVSTPDSHPRFPPNFISCHDRSNNEIEEEMDDDMRIT